MDDEKQAAVKRLKAGVAEAEITCQVGTELAAELNPRVSQGVRMPLMAKALVLSNGAESLAVVTLDLFGLQPDAAERLAQRVGERSGLRPDAVMVFCSHTRGAPYTTPVVGWPGVNDAYIAEVVERVPIEIEPCPDNERYLRTKCVKMGHLLNLND